MKNINLISISGRIGSGKDTIASMIQFLTNQKNFDKEIIFEDWNDDMILGNICNHSHWKVKKFAGKLKEIASILTGIPVEKFEDQEFKKSFLGGEWGYVVENPLNSIDPFKDIKFNNLMSIREFLQKLGTDGLRDGLHENVWVNALFADYDKNISIDIPIGTKSRDGRFKHGGKHTKIFTVYNNMKNRCLSKANPRYNDYGGRGIKICDDWLLDFSNFRLWAYNSGYSENMTIDRVDNDGDYSPSNCRIASISTQNINQRIRKDNTSGYKGVNFDKGGCRADIQIDKKRIFLGYFNTPEEASVKYQEESDKRLNMFLKRDIESTRNKPKIIITDTRFPNELQSIKDLGGLTIRLTRNDDVKSDHISETALDEAKFDYVIDNKGQTLEETFACVEKVIEELKIV